MNIFKLALSGLMISCAVIPVHAQSNFDSVVIRRISDEILRNGKAYENLRVLCKEVGPRLSGSSGAEKAILETARMLREAGADTVFLQPCMVPRWVRGAKEEAHLTLAGGKRQPIRVVALGNSVGTSKEGVNGTLVEVKDFAELERLGRNGIEGRIVFFNHPMDPTLVQTFRAYGQAGTYRSNGPSQAAKYGAVGVVIRSLASNVDDHPHTGAMRYNDSFPKLPAVAISTRDAEMLSAQLKKGAVRNLWFKSNAQMMGEVPSFNVVGELRGSE
jgi:hypothetical protein